MFVAKCNRGLQDRGVLRDDERVNLPQREDDAMKIPTYLKLPAWVSEFYQPWFPKKRARLELIYVTYAEGDRLIKENPGVWTIPREEDTNKTVGWVFLERLAPQDQPKPLGG